MDIANFKGGNIKHYSQSIACTCMHTYHLVSLTSTNMSQTGFSGKALDW